MFHGLLPLALLPLALPPHPCLAHNLHPCMTTPHTHTHNHNHISPLLAPAGQEKNASVHECAPPGHD